MKVAHYCPLSALNCWLHVRVWLENRKSGPISSLPHIGLSQYLCFSSALCIPLIWLWGLGTCFLLWFNVRESQVQASVRMGPAHGGAALEGTEYHGASPHPICIAKKRIARLSPPPVPPLIPFISPRGIHQSPKSLKPPGRRYRNVRPENLRLIHLSLPSPSFPLLEPYLRAITKQEANNIFYSSPCAVSQGEANQPLLYPGCPVLPRIIDHTNTSLYPWGGFGHLALLLAASHKSSLWLPVTAAQGCQDKSHLKG